MRIGTTLWAAVIMVSAAIGGCSSGNSTGSGGAGGAPDFTTLQTTLTTPTGTLVEGQESTVVGGYNKQAAASKDGNFLGGSSSGSSSTKSSGANEIALASLNVLADSCEALGKGGSGSCACPSGGTITFELPNGGFEALSGKGDGPVDAVLSLKADNCNDGKKSINGSMYVKVKKTDAKNVLMIYSIHLGITGSGTKDGQYDVDLLYETANGVFRIVFAVDVPDGKVLVSGTWDSKTQVGKITIRDKKGETVCESTGPGTGKCTGPDGKIRDKVKLDG